MLAMYQYSVLDNQWMEESHPALVELCKFYSFVQQRSKPAFDENLTSLRDLFVFLNKLLLLQRSPGSYIISGMKTITDNCTLRVDDVTVKINDSKILQDIKFAAKTGNVMAILGPTGSGKTTLLNTISGRYSPVSGHVTLNKRRLGKQLRRRLGFVLQQDLFLSNLTLWETLYFTAAIRISENIPGEEKTARINEIVDELDLKDCLHTVIGDMFNRGLSGGEKKRASIACELLTDPDILLLDEPTSGLDSSTALSLMKHIKQLSVNHNKMIILTIHQPSSQIYHMFDALLLLAGGQVAYFGSAHAEPIEFFQQFGKVCEPHFNPADFYLDVIKSEKSLMEEIIAAQRKRNSCASDGMQNGSCGENDSELRSGESNLSLSSKAYGSVDTVLSFDDITTVFQTKKTPKRWNTSFSTQFKMLTWRSFKQSRGRFFHIQDIIFYAILSTVASVLFFQIKQEQDTVRDRMGLLFFVNTFWTFEGCHPTIFAFPSERGVISKERLAGAYRFSAYYLAKTASELPLQIVMPTLFYTYIYWMTGLGGVSNFFMTWPMVLLATLTGQGLGMFVTSAILDTKVALICCNVVVLSSLLFSGFVTQTIPYWLTWAKYLSIINYPLSTMSIIMFRDMPDVPCNATSVSTFPKCLSNSTDFITAKDILANAGIEIPIYCYISTFVIIFAALRIFAYFTLRFRRIVVS